VEAEHERATMIQPRKRVASLTVLVVDDLAIVEVVREILEDEGYTVLTAVGATALARASAHRPAVILPDIAMPGMSGVEVSRHLRADPGTQRIPVVAMSAGARLASEGAAMAADAVLAKPFDLDDLLSVGARWAAPT